MRMLDPKTNMPLIPLDDFYWKVDEVKEYAHYADDSGFNVLQVQLVKRGKKHFLGVKIESDKVIAHKTLYDYETNLIQPYTQENIQRYAQDILESYINKAIGIQRKNNFIGVYPPKRLEKI